MFFPARGNNASEVRVNGEPFDASELEEARHHLLRGVFPDGPYPDLQLAGQAGNPVRPLCASVAGRAHGLPTTYTTAGTVYDPTSRLLLQPPNRRGRSSKPGPAIAQSDLALAAGGMSLLDPTGKLEGTGGSRMTTAASLRNYTPLQQNYDRAINPVNPFSEFDHQRPVSMPVQTSRKKQPDGLSPYYYDPELEEVVVRAISEEGDDKDKTRAGGGSKTSRSGNDEGNSRDDNAEDGCDKENDWGMDPLMNMPVKSLHNLASYPNPNQKKAQKILLLGAKPNVMKNLKLNSSSSPLAHSIEAPHGLDRPQGHERPFGYDDYHQSPSFPGMGDFKEHLPSLSLGLGAPKPLTAGPPGQRQYRPSNLGSVPRGLSPRHLLLPSYTVGSDDANPAATNASTYAMMDEVKAKSTSSSTSGRYMSEAPEHYPKLPPPSDRSFQAEPSMQEARDSGSWFSKAVDPFANPAACRDEPFFSYTHTPIPRGLTGSVAAESSSGRETFSHLLPMQPGSWASCEWDPSMPRAQYDAGVGRMSADQLAARNERIHSLWFQGTGLFGDGGPASGAIEAGDSPCHRDRSSFGAVGDGRPSGKAKTDKTSIERWRRLVVQEA